jgi:hypothetical protein
MKIYIDDTMNEMFCLHEQQHCNENSVVTNADGTTSTLKEAMEKAYGVKIGPGPMDLASTPDLENKEFPGVLEGDPTILKPDY